jgi:hypothetical protein
MVDGNPADVLVSLMMERVRVVFAVAAEDAAEDASGAVPELQAVSNKIVRAVPSPLVLDIFIPNSDLPVGILPGNKRAKHLSAGCNVSQWRRVWNATRCRGQLDGDGQ